MQLYLFALNFFLVVIETLALNLLTSALFEIRHSARRHFLLTAIYVFLSNLILLAFQNSTLFRIVGITLLALGWIQLSYRARHLWVKGLFMSVFWVSFLTVVDTLFLLSSSFFPVNRELTLLNAPFAYYLLCYSAKIFELLIAVLIRSWAKKHFHHQHSTWTEWLRTLFFPVASFAATTALIRALFLEPHLAKELFVCVFILLFADLMAILLLNYLDEQHRAILENTVLRQNLKLESEHIDSLKEAYAEQRKQTHDFQNQLAVLHDLALHDASQEEFADYLEQILSVSFPTGFYVNTGRLVVDIILSQKHAAAKSKGIHLRTQLSDLSDFPLPDDALVVVLTNLIDNAIEACTDSPEEKRHILLKMHNTPETALLYIENPTSHPVTIKNNRILTTKKDSIAHGYGLKNVYAILELNHAIYAIDFDPVDSMFCFSAQI